MISYTAALQIIGESLSPLSPDVVAPQSALGRVVSDPVASPGPVPPFPNAAVDGIALRARETRTASSENPLRLRIAGMLAAGNAPPQATPPGSAWEIMTGAALPADCDAVVPIERIETGVDEDGVACARLRQPARPGENCRNAGEDFATAQLVLPAGATITPEAVMALAATGCPSVRARPIPRVAVITTGNELLADHGAPAAGMIHDANGPYLAAALRQLGVPAMQHQVVRDDPEELLRAILAAQAQAELILTTGGVSAGRLDLVPAAVARAGGEILFHKVAIRPGKPLLYARWPKGACLFGLPGNPMAVAVGLRFFVIAALRVLQGLPPEQYPRACCEATVRKRPGLTFFAKAYARVDGHARLQVAALAGQESFRIAPLLQANCWAIIREGREEVGAGELLEVAPLFPGPFPASAA